MDNPEKRAKLCTQDTRRKQTNKKHDMWWTPLYTNKHK